jgi:hypothetical protein
MENDYSIYVSSEGIRQLCDIDIFDNSDTSLIENVKENSILYIKGNLLSQLIPKILKITKHFILVTGHEDTTIPYDVFKTKKLFESFCNNSYLKHWFCQNCAVPETSKLTKLPIGMDYHTMANCTTLWGEKKNVSIQEAEFIEIIKQSKPFYEKEHVLCYHNFGHVSYKNIFGYERKDVERMISTDIVLKESNFLKRIDTWKRQSEIVFMLSPHGNGLDCHRTWESLLLKNIVIVKTSPLDCLYTDLPVLIVNDWSDLNKELLYTTIDIFKTKQFDYSRLYLNYWKNLIYKEKETLPQYAPARVVKRQPNHSMRKLSFF